MEKQSFDFEAFKKQAASRIKNGDTLLGKEGVLTPLLKEFLEGALEGELEAIRLQIEYRTTRVWRL